MNQFSTPEHLIKVTDFSKMVMSKTLSITLWTTSQTMFVLYHEYEEGSGVHYHYCYTGVYLTACCSCPTGLSGYCNHVTATLYCLEDYIHLGLQEDEKKGCTNPGWAMLFPVPLIV